tara:strand:- start:5017 stop:5295 length:279 start_codon:yes stop_codon:yes gene_type:complete
MKADKAKIVDEVWDDARIDGFLTKAPMGNEDAEFSILLHAFRSMRPEDFARFLSRYRSLGYSTEATNRQGQTLCQIISSYRNVEPFKALLRP